MSIITERNRPLLSQAWICLNLNVFPLDPLHLMMKMKKDHNLRQSHYPYVALEGHCYPHNHKKTDILCRKISIVYTVVVCGRHLPLTGDHLHIARDTILKNEH